MSTKQRKSLPRKSASAKPRRNAMKQGQLVRPKSNTTQKAVQQPYLSQCAIDYARALVNPFDGPLACVPTFTCVPTRRVRNFVRGEFRTGTNGVGFVSCDPINGLCNDVAFVAHTNSGYAGTTIEGFPPPAGVLLLAANSDYNSASFLTSGPTAIAGRVVACGLRAKYIGTTLNQGGTMCLFHDPTQESLDTRNYASLMAEEGAISSPVTREWTTITWRPAILDDFDFFQKQTINDILATMCIMVEAADPAVSLAFQFEAYGIYEYNGRMVRGMTSTHDDPTGLAAVLHVSQQKGNHIYKGQSAAHEGGFLGKVMQVVDKGISGVKTFISDVESGVKFATLKGAELYQMGQTVSKVGAMIGI